MNTFVELKNSFVNFINSTVANGTDALSSTKQRKPRRRGRVCRFEELEGREMLSVTPWAFTDSFQVEDHDDDHDHSADWAYVLSGHDCGFCNGVFEATHGATQDATANTGTVNAPVVALDQTFKLHSNASAKHTIYLDFTGGTTTGTSWNSAFTKGAAIVTPAFSIDADPAFSATELQRIQEIWARVAEDFAPFNVNVTTEQPSADKLVKSGTNDDSWGIRVMIGGNGSWYGSAGGVAYVGSFNLSTDTPCFVFSDNLGKGNVKYVADAITHEVGHTLGLNHDGRTSPSEEYYQGANGWAPIMGVGYYQTLTQWSKGEYDNSSNKEDDLAIITTKNGFGYRADDHGNTITTATVVSSATSTAVIAGIIETNKDVDFFKFSTTGLVSIDIVSGNGYKANLDVLAKIYDANGIVIATADPQNTLNASFTNMQLAAGVYYLSVEGTGKAGVYTDYGSIGTYTVAFAGLGTVVAPPPASTKLNAPSLNNVVAKGSNAITATWAAVANANGYIIQYATNSSFTGALTKTVDASATSADITGLNENTIYYVRVMATGTGTYTDSDYSAAKPVMTDRILVPPTTPAGLTSTAKTTDSITVTWNTVSNATSYELQYRKAGATAWTNVKVSGTSAQIGGLTANTAYEFQVLAVNADGKSNWTATVSVTTERVVAPPTAPANFKSTAQATNSVTLSWTEQANLTGYTLQYRVSGSTTWTTATAPKAGDTTATISGLVANTAYEFQLTAINVDGSKSSITTATTKTATVAAVNPITPTVTVESKLTTANSVTMSFAGKNKNESLAGNVEYVITCSEVSGNGNGNNKVLSNTITLVAGVNCEYIITNGVISGVKVFGLDANTKYEFSITAKNADGKAANATSVSVQTTK